jgi:putative ATPase
MVDCPICGKNVNTSKINDHIDSNCTDYVEAADNGGKTTPVSNFFRTSTARKDQPRLSNGTHPTSSPTPSAPHPSATTAKRQFDEISTVLNGDEKTHNEDAPAAGDALPPQVKRSKPNALQKAAPLAERMRPKTLDDILGQELLGPDGVLRGLIESDKVPSMILWGGPGSGKTTCARVIATMVGSRFVEINSTSSGVAELKKIFAEARSELSLTGRKTILFCDEIHRFNKSQQDTLLAPVEAGIVSLIGATTENPSFKVNNALLSRCRTFTLQKLSDEDIAHILQRALDMEMPERSPSSSLDEQFMQYLASFADGDARTALNLLELSISLLKRQPDIKLADLKSALTKTLVYDRSGDQHYDTISALHKSIRGSDPDAALYYLARMIASGEDALYIARRMIVMASEDIGLADNTLLPLAIAAYTACEKVGMPEAKINLAHVAVALALAPKSTRAYRGLASAMRAIEQEPGVGGLPIPIHLRNAPTKLMKELGYGKEYKYNPNYRGGRVKQDYLPEKLKGRRFLEDLDLGTEIDPELSDDEMTADVEDAFDHSFHGEHPV